MDEGMKKESIVWKMKTQLVGESQGILTQWVFSHHSLCKRLLSNSAVWWALNFLSLESDPFKIRKDRPLGEMERD